MAEAGGDDGPTMLRKRREEVARSLAAARAPALDVEAEAPSPAQVTSPAPVQRPRHVIGAEARTARGQCIGCRRPHRPDKKTCGRCGPYKNRPAADAVPEA